jgi:putative transcriptional regulator
MKEEAFSKLVNSVRQAGQIKRKQLKPSRVIEHQAADIKAIRSGLQKSQAEFAMMIGVSKDTLQNWEQGRRRPVGPARALLKIAQENPKAVVEALG